MNTIDAIRARHSTRCFAYEPIAKDLLIQLVDSGRRAPSGRNEQPIEYIVVDDPKIIHEIAGMTDNGRFAADAGALVILVAMEDAKYYLEDGSAASQNVLLAATAQGLASCWIAGDKKYYASQVCSRLDVPDDRKLVSILAIGKASERECQKPRPAISEQLHWNRFRAH